MAIRLSGMNSGLDTDSIVKELVSAYSLKKENIQKKQTKLEWKQDAWKSMNTKIYSFYSKNLSNMRLSSSYNVKSASVSDANVAKVTANTSAVNGTQQLKVKQLATSGYLTGSKITDANGEKLGLSSNLSQVKGLESLASMGSIEVGVGDKSKRIELNPDMKISELVNKLKDAGVNASFDEGNKRFFISAKTSGADGDFSLVGSDANAVEALKKLGIYSASKAESDKYTSLAGMDVAAAVDAEYAKKKVAYTDADTQKKLLNDELNSLTAANKKLSETNIYESTKASYLGKAFDPGYDKQVHIADIEADIKRYEEEIKQLDANDALSADEKKEQKTLYENQIKAAKDAVAVLGNDLYVEADIKAAYDKASENATKASDSLAENNARINEITDILKDDSSIEAYVTDKNLKIDEENAKIREDLTKYYTDLKSFAASASLDASTAASRIVGQDSIIELNGAEFTSNTNNYSINGLTIQATAITGDDAVTITTSTDVDGIYNKVKDFFKEYNELIKAMDTAYNAASAKEYEPLTDEEKEAMTDDQIEKWETKIKDALLRKDSTLGDLSSVMKSIMSQSYEVNGVKMSLKNFGIATSGYFGSGTNEKGVYHIDGDEDDSATSGNEDKLKAAIASDPEMVTQFFTKLSSALYSKLTDKMSSSSLSSAYTVYNDKQMTSQLNNYKSDISDWEEKIETYEERYYKQFAAMEKALATLNSQTSQLSSLLGQ